MADSDSDPFESADEGENESKKAFKKEEPKSDEKYEGQGDEEESNKDEVHKADQKDMKSDEDHDDAKNENIDERIDEELSTQDNNTPSETDPPQPSDELSSPGTTEESSPPTTDDRISDKGDEVSKTSTEDKTDQEESKAPDQEVPEAPDQEGSKAPDQEGPKASDGPKAPEEQTIAGSLDRLAGAVAGDSGEKSVKQESKPSGGWGGSWGGWGSSLLTSATSKVSEMGHGLSHVIENVETSLGVPKPEDLPGEPMKVASDDLKEGEGPKPVEKEQVPQEQQEKEDNEESSVADGQSAQSPGYLGGWFSYGASALTNVVEKTVTGGLDALELIGKKTMDVLQEGDPGFRNKRDYISKKTGQSINLSQMLREAKESAEMATQAEEEQREMEKVHFGILFDNYQGLAHLEALEMLSNQSEMKVHSLLASLSGDQLSAIQTELDEIKDAFQIEDLESDEIDESIDEQDFVNIITEHLFGVCVAATPDKLQKVQKGAHEWLVECQRAQEEGDKKDPKDLHIKAIETLAELSARSIEQFHKSSELMLLHQDKDQHKGSIQRAVSLSKLTSTLCAELGSLAGKFCERLNVIANDDVTENASETVNPIITNIYLEASNSSSYIQDAFQLLLPVLQTLALENNIEETKTKQEKEPAS